MDKSVPTRRFLNHLGETNIWTVVLYVVFTASLMLSAYLFWWHNRTYVSYLVEMEEQEEKENEDV